MKPINENDIDRIYKAKMPVLSATKECPEGPEFALFLDGKLSSEEFEKVSVHVKSCPYCNAEVLSFRAAEKSERSLSIRPPQEKQPVVVPFLRKYIAPAIKPALIAFVFFATMIIIDTAFTDRYVDNLLAVKQSLSESVTLDDIREIAPSVRSILAVQVTSGAMDNTAIVNLEFADRLLYRGKEDSEAGFVKFVLNSELSRARSRRGVFDAVDRFARELRAQFLKPSLAYASGPRRTFALSDKLLADARNFDDAKWAEREKINKLPADKKTAALILFAKKAAVFLDFRAALSAYEEVKAAGGSVDFEIAWCTKVLGDYPAADKAVESLGSSDLVQFLKADIAIRSDKPEDAVELFKKLGAESTDKQLADSAVLQAAHTLAFRLGKKDDGLEFAGKFGSKEVSAFIEEVCGQ